MARESYLDGQTIKFYELISTTVKELGVDLDVSSMYGDYRLHTFNYRKRGKAVTTTVDDPMVFVISVCAEQICRNTLTLNDLKYALLVVATHYDINVRDRRKIFDAIFVADKNIASGKVDAGRKVKTVSTDFVKTLGSFISESCMRGTFAI